MNPLPTHSDARLARLETWLADAEDEHCEFKEWRTKADFEELGRYCCALANEGGGRMLLGVSDRRPRHVVATSAVPQPEDTRRALMQKLPLNIQVEEYAHPNGRVVVFHVPPRPIGIPMMWDGRYWARRADSLVAMAQADLQLIFAESGRDFSAEVCAGARLEHLDPTAVAEFRQRWARKSGNDALLKLPDAQLLRDSELLLGDDGVTYAALALLGSREALGQFLAQAEIVFEYRSSPASGPAQERLELRRGFLAIQDELWRAIAKRNDLQHYQEGLFILDIPTFDERGVREALLNAVCHRNYQLAGSVFVRQYPSALVIESPGGLPHGVTPANILDRQSPRNRRIAEALARCGLVERSGQGMDLMFERSLRQGKQRPDLTGTDANQVVLTLNGQVQDLRFARYLEQLLGEHQRSLGTHDFVLLDLVHREQPIPDDLKPRLAELRELGAVESIGRGRGTRYLLARRFYATAGRSATHTRRKGLDRAQNKELLVNHLRQAGTSGCPISELEQVLPAVSRKLVQRLLSELRDAGRVELLGEKRAARWRVRQL